ncbi:MAG: YcjF family protein [Mangrovicoccus sp.]
MNGPQNGPVVFDLETELSAPADPTAAPPVPEETSAVSHGHGQAMTQLTAMAARPVSPLRRWFLAVFGAFAMAMIGWASWAAIAALVAKIPVLGGFVALLGALSLAIALLLVIKEIAALSRLARLDHLRQAADRVLAEHDLTAARKLGLRLQGFYRQRVDLKWSGADLEARLNDAFDPDAALAAAEQAMVSPLDAAAIREVEAAARQVATVTALVPLALADVITAMVVNLRMVRRISEIYGGRAGTLGSWKLIRAVFVHLAATGIVSAGDDLVTSVLGGSALSRISRRFGEGIVNGALTARVGVAAIEICRPLPFLASEPPKVSQLVRRALSGLFAQAEQAKAQ